MNKFNLIVADPPYSFDDKLVMSDVKRGAEANYKVMSNEDIINLPVLDIVEDDALLALWVPSALLQLGLDIMKSWGFIQKQTHIWIKIKKEPFKNIKSIEELDNFDFNNILTFGMGKIFRGCHELCLIGTRGKINSKVKNLSQRSVHFYENKKHSAKPEILQDRLDIMFPEFEGKKLEMFARRTRNGWNCIGNECEGSLGEDILDSLKKLKDM